MQIYKINVAKPTIYNSMVLNESDIREMVIRCVGNLLLEYHHVIDSSLEELAEKVMDLGRMGGGTISPEYINKLNPYFKAKVPIVVKVINGNAYNASMGHGDLDGILEIDAKTIKSPRYKEIIMHELTHFVNLDAATKLYTDNVVNGNRFVNNVLYVFRPTEMQARLSEYYYFLKRNKVFINKSLTYRTAESVLRIKEMMFYLNMLKAAQYGRKDSCFYLLMVISHSEIAKRNMRRHGTNEIGDIKGNILQTANPNTITEKEFNNRKNAVIKLYEKRLRNYINKASKIKYDAMVSQS